MMFSIVLNTISISIVGFQFVNAAECPEGFDKFKRIPTERNNHTSDYCLKVVKSKYGRVGDGRSLCKKAGGQLTIVENQQEYDYVVGIATAQNFSIAVDGRTRFPCGIYSLEQIAANYRDCGKTKRYYELFNEDTDPTFIFSKFTPKKPTKLRKKASKHDYDSGCLYMAGTNSPTNATFNDYGCRKRLTNMQAALCGKKI